MSKESYGKPLATMYVQMERKNLLYQKELAMFVRRSESNHPAKLFRRKVARLANLAMVVDKRSIYLTLDNEGFYDLITLKKAKGAIKVNPYNY